jgi:hypothetical protein
MYATAIVIDTVPTLPGVETESRKSLRLDRKRERERELFSPGFFW